MTTETGTREERSAYLEERFGGWQRLVHARELRVVDSFLERLERSASRILDAPSGHGRFTPRLLRLAAAAGRGRRRAPIVVSCDRARERLAALARAEGAGGPGAGARLLLARLDLLRPLPFPPRAFDLVFCLRFLHHVRTPEARRRVLEELARVSSRHVIISYYATGTLHSLQKPADRVLRALRGRRRSNVVMIRRRELLGLLDEIGCRLVAERAALPGVHAQRLALLERR